MLSTITPSSRNPSSPPPNPTIVMRPSSTCTTPRHSIPISPSFPSPSPLRHSLVPPPPVPPPTLAAPGSTVPLPLTSTPLISTLILPPTGALPISFSLAARHSPPSASLIRLPPAPPNTIDNHFELEGSVPGAWGSMPSSLKDLQTLAYAHSGASTVRPIKIRGAGAGAGVTMGLRGRQGVNVQRQGQGQVMGLGGSLGFESRLKEIESDLLRRYQNPQSPSSSFTPTTQPASSGNHSDTSTIRPKLDALPRALNSAVASDELTGGERGAQKGAIDELDVEWCFHCSLEAARDHMYLQNMNDAERGWQWVCEGCREK